MFWQQYCNYHGTVCLDTVKTCNKLNNCMVKFPIMNKHAWHGCFGKYLWVCKERLISNG